MTTFILLLLFVFSIFLTILIRTKSDGKYEIKITDVIISLIPVFLWLLLTGQILELGIGDLKVKLKEAYQKPVTGQITDLVRGNELITIGIDCQTSFEDDILNVETFPSYLPFKYILIEENCKEDKNGNSNPIFWGIMSVTDYKQIFLDPYSKADGHYFLNLIKSKDAKELKKLIPSYISINNAITAKSNKLLALENMEKLDSEYLPVINEKKEFLGIIDRSKVNSSFLIDIGKALNKE